MAFSQNRFFWKLFIGNSCVGVSLIKKEALTGVFQWIQQEILKTPMAASENAVFGFSQEIPALLKWIEIHFNTGNSYFSIPSRLTQKVIVIQAS